MLKTARQARTPTHRQRPQPVRRVNRQAQRLATTHNTTSRRCFSAPTKAAPLAADAFQSTTSDAGSSHSPAGADVAESPASLSYSSVEHRFSTRNAFLKRRHVQKDHIAQTHHNDVRLIAGNITATVQEAAKRHKMSLQETELWGGYAAATSLYAGLIDGNDRVTFEAFLNNKANETSHIYVEAFAVGEIRGFATMVNPDVDETTGRKLPGQGASRLTKVLHKYRRKFYSSVPATGDPMNDWMALYNQSEQLPTYVQTETLVREDETTGEVIVDFCGASLVQTLGGPAINQDEKIRLLAQKPWPRKEDEAEDDDAYVKRMQLYEFRNKIVELDIPTTVQKYGAAGYISSLLGTDPETLGRPTNIRNIGNINDDFDYELFERATLATGLREKPLVNIENIETKESVTELPSAIVSEQSNTPVSVTHSLNMLYRPLQFFCRCFQTPPKDKLASLPMDLLQDIVRDVEVTFTCDFCATPTTIPQEEIKTAIQNKLDLEEKLVHQRILDEAVSQSKPLDAPQNVEEHIARDTHVHTQDCRH